MLSFLSLQKILRMESLVPPNYEAGGQALGSEAQMEP